jgi:hypothetical protein
VGSRGGDFRCHRTARQRSLGGKEEGKKRERRGKEEGKKRERRGKEEGQKRERRGKEEGSRERLIDGGAEQNAKAVRFDRDTGYRQ